MAQEVGLQKIEKPYFLERLDQTIVHKLITTTPLCFWGSFDCSPGNIEKMCQVTAKSLFDYRKEQKKIAILSKKRPYIPAEGFNLTELELANALFNSGNFKLLPPKELQSAGPQQAKKFTELLSSLLFLRGAIQEDTKSKISIFTPNDEQSPYKADVIFYIEEYDQYVPLQIKLDMFDYETMLGPNLMYPHDIAGEIASGPLSTLTQNYPNMFTLIVNRKLGYFTSDNLQAALNNSPLAFHLGHFSGPIHVTSADGTTKTFDPFTGKMNFVLVNGLDGVHFGIRLL